MTYICLKCIKVGSRLRVRVISPGYNHDANTQFPKNIRKAGRKYKVPKEYLKFRSGPRGTFFYSIKCKNQIKICDEDIDINLKNIKIYGDKSEPCCICMENEKELVFIPCGHFCCCQKCFNKLKSRICPMCRCKDIKPVHKSKL